MTTQGYELANDTQICRPQTAPHELHGWARPGRRTVVQAEWVQ